MLLKCCIGEDSWGSLGLQGGPPVHSEGDQSWVFFGRADAKAETPIFWPPHTKSWLIGKDSDAGRDWGQEEKGTTEDEMAGWHHQLNGHVFRWTPGVGDAQGGLACCDSWGHKESNTTEWLNWTELNWGYFCFYLFVYIHSCKIIPALLIEKITPSQFNFFGISVKYKLTIYMYICLQRETLRFFFNPSTYPLF